MCGFPVSKFFVLKPANLAIGCAALPIPGKMRQGLCPSSGAGRAGKDGLLFMENTIPQPLRFVKPTSPLATKNDKISQNLLFFTPKGFRRLRFGKHRCSPGRMIPSVTHTPFCSETFLCRQYCAKNAGLWVILYRKTTGTREKFPKSQCQFRNRTPGFCQPGHPAGSPTACAEGFFGRFLSKEPQCFLFYHSFRVLSIHIVVFVENRPRYELE